jgi:hypothetical protein
MVATAVLALGAVLIYEAFFLSLDIFGYCANYLKLASWADELVWEAQDLLTYSGETAQIPTNGVFVSANKKFTWNLSYCALAQEHVYSIGLVVSWKEGTRVMKLFRDAYAIHKLVP